jgi:hypothetical protein
MPAACMWKCAALPRLGIAPCSTPRRQQAPAATPHPTPPSPIPTTHTCGSAQCCRWPPAAAQSTRTARPVACRTPAVSPALCAGICGQAPGCAASPAPCGRSSAAPSVRRSCSRATSLLSAPSLPPPCTSRAFPAPCLRPSPGELRQGNARIARAALPTAACSEPAREPARETCEGASPAEVRREHVSPGGGPLAPLDERRACTLQQGGWVGGWVGQEVARGAGAQMELVLQLMLAWPGLAWPGLARRPHLRSPATCAGAPATRPA